MKITLSLILIFSIIPFNFGFAETIYVDTTGVDSNFPNEALNCAVPFDTDYNPSTRQCGSGTATVYDTIQGAITNCSAGDDIQIRNGTYSEYDIDIPESKNGTAWTVGQYTTLRSYPGEWAIIDGSANSDYPVIRHPTSCNKDQTNDTAYWKFERLEITGGRFGILLTKGPLWVRYCYFHDNTDDYPNDEPQAALWINEAQNCTIEYNYFYNNHDTTSSTNDSQIGFLADYHEEAVDGAEGETFNIYRSINSNEIKYNVLIGGDSSVAASGIHYKGDQRYGNNSRNPALVRSAHGLIGDKIHHNIILDHQRSSDAFDKSILAGIDNLQVYKNIVSGQIITQGWQHIPQTYNAVVYNNTLIGSKSSIVVGSGVLTQASPSNIQNNYYDAGQAGDPANGYDHTVTPNVWIYNNIIANNDGLFTHGEPINVAHFMPEDWGNFTDNESCTHDFSLTVVDRNLFHNSPDELFHMGSCDNGISPANCGKGELNHKFQTISEFNTHSAAWRGVESVTNWDLDTANLFMGTSGANRYVTVGTYDVGGVSGNVSNSGIGGNHPYLAGIALPTYLGATNPIDNAWVEGVLTDLTSTTWLKSMSLERNANDDPIWLEGQTDPAPVPSAPQNLILLTN